MRVSVVAKTAYLERYEHGKPRDQQVRMGVRVNAQHDVLVENSVEVSCEPVENALPQRSERLTIVTIVTSQLPLKRKNQLTTVFV